MAKHFCDDDETLQRCREYLKKLASGQVDAWLRRREDESDIVQQTMLDGVARQDQFRGTTEKQFFSWMRSILVNNIVDAVKFHRRAKRNAADSPAGNNDATASAPQVEALIADSTLPPSMKALANEQRNRLFDALELLPEGQRSAIILHHLQGLTLSETSAILDRSESAVGGLLRRGLKRLHELLRQ